MRIALLCVGCFLLGSWVGFLARSKDIVGRVMAYVEDDQELYPDIEGDIVDWE